jgi:hypothetical protein
MGFVGVGPANGYLAFGHMEWRSLSVHRWRGRRTRWHMLLGRGRRPAMLGERRHSDWSYSGPGGAAGNKRDNLPGWWRNSGRLTAQQSRDRICLYAFQPKQSSHRADGQLDWRATWLLLGRVSTTASGWRMVAVNRSRLRSRASVTDFCSMMAARRATYRRRPDTPIGRTIYTMAALDSREAMESSTSAAVRPRRTVLRMTSSVPRRSLLRCARERRSARARDSVAGA